MNLDVKTKVCCVLLAHQTLGKHEKGPVAEIKPPYISVET